MRENHITILGGGPAGLATGYFAGLQGIPFKIYEARDRAGGNAVTLQRGDFRFDTGAHRFHDKDPEVTRVVRSLLGDELLEIHLPSHIYSGGKFIEFPLSPLNLIRTLDPLTLVKAAMDLAWSGLGAPSAAENFEQAALRKYGRTIAERFLLNYSRKLWGREGTRLSWNISGARLQGMSPAMLIREIFFGDRSSPAHLEGKFLYPKLGYGRIVEALAAECGERNIRLGAAVTAIRHNGSRIEGVSLQSGENVAVGSVVNTLPLSFFLAHMEPQPSAEILALANSLQFRNVLLIAIFLDRERLSNSATIYFPDLEFPFTRIYEPANRSRLMAPPGKTSLCVEYPCFATDAIWRMDEDELVEQTCRDLQRVGLFEAREVLDAKVVRLNHAYPVLELGSADKIKALLDYLVGFSNLRVIGRNGRFVYTHVHDMIRFGLDTVAELAAHETGASSSTPIVAARGAR